MKGVGMLALALLQMAAPTPTPEPTPAAPRAVLERFVTTPVQFSRLSVFDNRIAVVSLRNGDQVVVRRRLLAPTVYATYLAAVVKETAAIDPDTVKKPISDSPPVRAELHLALDPGQPPREIHYSPLRIQGLPLERLQRLLDDLEAEVLATSPAQVDLATWQPRVGDRVELMIGREATVVRVEDDGYIVVLEHDGTHVREVVPVAGRTSTIRALLDRRP